MKLNFFHRRHIFFQLCAAVPFLFCTLAVNGVAQSTKTSEADVASGAIATYQKGMIALQQGDLAAARAAFERVVRLAPNSPEGHNSLGWVLLAQG